MFKNEKNLRHHFKTHHENVQQTRKVGYYKQYIQTVNYFISLNVKGKNAEEKKKKEPPKYPCHMCETPVLFALTALR